MNLSEKLQNRRKEMALTQEDVAEKIHVSRQTISNWETGKTLPDINSLVLISDIYDISLDDLIKEDVKVIKRLSLDTKQIENWFVSACVLNNALSLLISYQSDNLETRIVVLLLILQTLITSYIGVSGYTFLKRNQEVLRKTVTKEMIKLNIGSKNSIKSQNKIVDGNAILYGVTILCGFITVIITALTIS